MLDREQGECTVASGLPGCHGEHLLQERQGSGTRARAFYQKQMLDRLNPFMQQFVGEQEMFFLASADSQGECDCSFRAGEKGFVRVLGERTLAYPELRGNGVYGSLGNILENPHVGMLFLDFFRNTIGLHVNGRAHVRTPEEMRRDYPAAAGPPADPRAGAGPLPELWVVVEVEEAYIHCSKHIPLLARLPKEIDWGTDEVRKKGGDYFHAKTCDRPWATPSANGTSPE